MSSDRNELLILIRLIFLGWLSVSICVMVIYYCVIRKELGLVFLGGDTHSWYQHLCSWLWAWSSSLIKVISCILLGPQQVFFGSQTRAKLTQRHRLSGCLVSFLESLQTVFHYADLEWQECYVFTSYRGVETNCLLRFPELFWKLLHIKRANSGVQTSSCLAGVWWGCRHWCPVRAEVMAERSTHRKCVPSSPLSVAQTQERQGPSRTKAWLTSTEEDINFQD